MTYKECGTSITCYTIKSGACYSVQENVMLILWYTVRMWAYTGTNDVWICSWAAIHRTCTTFLLLCYLHGLYSVVGVTPKEGSLMVL